MEDVLRFWGLGPQHWNELNKGSGVSQNLGKGAEVCSFGQIHFTEKVFELLQPYSHYLETGIPAYVIHSSSEPSADGEVVAKLEREGSDDRILVTRNDSGCWVFHFDVDATIQFVQQENYFETKPPFFVRFGISTSWFPSWFRKRIVEGFHLIRRFISSQDRVCFPGQKMDFSVDVWRHLIREIAAQHLDEKEFVDLWPEGKTYAVVLNHDVDSSWGFQNERGIESFRSIEESHGFRSAWMVVTRLFSEGESVLDDLADKGHEIGCHGILHDAKLAYLPIKGIQKRMKTGSAFIDKYKCRGFRSPSYHRTRNLYGVIDDYFDYDMSMHDTFEDVNRPGVNQEGCSTVFPFMLQDTNLLQIPTTVPEDFSLELSGMSPSEALGTQKEALRSLAFRKGVANIHTHPEPQLSARPEWIENYRQLIDHLAEDEVAWVALPCEVCKWWKERSQRIDEMWNKEEMT